LKLKKALGSLTIVSALIFGAAACSDDNSSDNSNDTTTTTQEIESVLWDNGACDTSLEVYKVGLEVVFESAVLTLKDQADALPISVDAFNARGGIGGHCMEAVVCDTGFTEAGEVACANKFVDEGVVVTVNDTTTISGAAGEILNEAGIQRLQISPGTPELSQPNSWPITAGGFGTTFVMFPGCAKYYGAKKVAVIHVDSPSIGALFALMKPMVDAYGAELTAKIPVPAGTTDYTQLVLAAEDSGAECVMLPLGEQEAIQVLNAAKQLGTEMKFSVSGGTFGLTQIRTMGDFASQIVLNNALPPFSGDQTKWPILADAERDFAEFGDNRDNFSRESMKESPFRSWVGIYSLVRIVEDFGTPDTVTREAIKAAILATKDLDMQGLTAPWTPSVKAEGSLFPQISNPWYYILSYDPAADDFAIEADQYNFAKESAGTIEYAQPTS